MSWLNNIRIARKIATGFGLVLALLAVVAVSGVMGLGGAGSDFTDYRELARQTNASGRVQANMLETRIFAINFLRTGSDEAIKGVRENAAQTRKLAEDFKGLITDKTEIAKADQIVAQLDMYVAAFEAVVKHQAKRNELVDDRLNVLGPQMEKDLSGIMQSAYRDNDAEAAFRAGETLRNLLLARLYVNRYLVDNDEAAANRVRTEFDAFVENETELLASLQNPTRRALAQTVSENAKLYKAAFQEVVTTITARNEQITGTMNKVGPEVARLTEEMKLTVLKQQDTLGPQAAAGIQKTQTIVTVVSIAAVAIGVLFAWMIGKGISGPISAMT